MEIGCRKYQVSMIFDDPCRFSQKRGMVWQVLYNLCCYDNIKLSILKRQWASEIDILSNRHL